MPSRLAQSSGGQTRFAQTMPAFSLDWAPRLGHAKWATSIQPSFSSTDIIVKTATKLGVCISMSKECEIKILERALASSDDKARWAAAAELGEFVYSEPDLLWPIVLKHGSSPDEDLRAAVATCLLEHILEHHFDAFFPKLKIEILKENSNLRNTLELCWKFNLTKVQVARWEKLLKETSKKRGKRS